MTLPASLLTGVLTWDIGDLAADGAGGLTLEALAGAAVTFVAAPAYLSDATSGKLILPKPIGPVALSAGQQELALTDTDAVNPQAWTWTMLTTLPGGLVLAPITFGFPASALDGDGRARLVDLAPVASSGGVLTLRGPVGPRGPAGIEPQGTWDAGTAYATDDAVYRNGSSYWAVQGSTGVDPETDSDSTYWHIMAEKGDPGDVSTVDSVSPDDAGNVALGALRAANNLSDVADAATARSNIGAGTSSFTGAYSDLTGKPTYATVATTGAYSDLAGKPTLGTAAAVDTGTAAGDVPVLGTGGVLPIARLATGTPNGSKFVRDDGTLAAPGGAAAPTWTTPTISGATTPTGCQAVRYCKDGLGWVHIEGAFTNSSSIAGGSILFTLPIGMRPAAIVPDVLLGVDAATDTPIPFHIDSDGSMQVGNTFSSGAAASGTAIGAGTVHRFNLSFYVGT